MSPRATAIRGTRRSAPDVRRLIPRALTQDEATAAIIDGRVNIASAMVLWNVDDVAIPQLIHEFEIPGDLYLRPVRRIGTYQGAPSRMGGLPIIRDDLAIMLELESREEHGWARAITIEPGVTWMHTQPFVLIWPDVDDGSIIHVPDILAVRYDQPIVVDVKPAEVIDDYDRLIFQLTATTLESVGIEYRVRGDISLQAKAHLIGVRRQRNINPRYDHLVQLVRQHRPATAHHVFTLCGSVPVGRLVLFHLIANAACRIDIDDPMTRSTQIEWVLGAS